jgi:hypothetical protein
MGSRKATRSPVPPAPPPVGHLADSATRYVGTDGTRRFTVVELSESERAAAEPGLPEVSTARGLALVASVGGYALMLDRGIVDRAQLLTHDEARLILQYVEHHHAVYPTSGDALLLDIE